MRALTQSLLLLVSPSKGWTDAAAQPSSIVSTLLFHTLPLALIPALCWYIGVTQAGWKVAGETIRLTPASAAPMCVLFYFAMVAGVLFLAAMVHWMAATYHSAADGNPMGDVKSARLAAAIQLISFTATPFFIAGLLGLHPLLWLDLTIGTAVAAWCIFLLYGGVPRLMRVPPEQGFLYASAVLAVALVAFVGVLTATVLLWDFGPSPEYTY